MTAYSAKLNDYNRAAASAAYPRDAAPEVPTTRDASLAYHSMALGEVLNRINERLDAFHSLADFAAGTTPMDGSISKTEPSMACGVVAELGERVMQIDMRLNALAHEFGRLERAIRG